RDSARHRLDHRHPETLEARGIDEDARAAVQARQLAVRREAEAEDSRRMERRLFPPTGGADHRERELGLPKQRMRREERAEVLPRLERRNGEGIGPSELGVLAL